MKLNQIKMLMNQFHVKYPEPCYPIINMKPYSSYLVVRNFNQTGCYVNGIWDVESIRKHSFLRSVMTVEIKNNNFNRSGFKMLYFVSITVICETNPQLYQTSTFLCLAIIQTI